MLLRNPTIRFHNDNGKTFTIYYFSTEGTMMFVGRVTSRRKDKFTCASCGRVERKGATCFNVKRAYGYKRYENEARLCIHCGWMFVYPHDIITARS